MGVSCAEFKWTQRDEMVGFAVVQLTGNVQVFVQLCAGGEGASGTCSEVMDVLEFSSSMERYSCVDCWWLEQ